MKYKNHKDIPAKYRRIILDETLSKRISKVPLIVCNSIIEECEEQEKEMDSLRDFEIIVVKENKKTIVHTKDPDSALAQLDKFIGYFEKDSDIVVVMRQAGRLIKAYVKGKWINGSVSIYD